ncbi:2-oxoglutarate ferredoxin oxidoreductase subunit beta [Caldalkalibacillus uzonensis]|uniref:2-oxoglutarate ferredoxin oxidoreductase subunit beta n=1 Tax=Caldalkalibacillus uzonensis TaxID=353224 RepID=A0ABU0CXC6_9BACI|nr:2-oxoacid:ferredoxin oxidoreductase subunit beta [Caldalkalibacillus uzonensis]MDQ0340699.1 2-oxoglutarate ferredoxin oxidoreductase subunit beta [Caldalkalibacillus uzonensis]
MAKLKEFKGDTPTWCPGCGHYSVMAGIQRACLGLGLEPHQVAVITGIGCSGKVSEYMRCYGFHTLHGRSLPVAQAVKLVNRNLKVIAAGGDGDGYGIGAGHFVHAARRNVDITYVVMDNQIYGLTKGQTSPTSRQGFVTKTSPEGAGEREVKPLELALGAGASFVAQAFAGDIKRLTELIQQGMEHEGFALINVFSPCVTYNKVNTYDYFKEHLLDLKQMEDYDPHDLAQAYATVLERQGLVQGIIYKEDRPAYHTFLTDYPDQPIAEQNLVRDDARLQQLWSEFK